MTAFPNTMTTPPGGEWFWEDRDVFIHSRSYHDVIDAMRRHFREKGITKDPAEALADYMCPRMPRGFCHGRSDDPVLTLDQIVRNTIDLCRGLPLEMVDTVRRRLEKCAACDMCDHPVCVTCRGVDKRIYEAFGGRRAPLDADRKSGVCRVCGAFVMGLVSVRHDKALEGAPESCWRNDK